jgi:hypothetical protein
MFVCMHTIPSTATQPRIDIITEKLLFPKAQMILHPSFSFPFTSLLQNYILVRTVRNIDRHEEFSGFDYNPRHWFGCSEEEQLCVWKGRRRW